MKRFFFLFAMLLAPLAWAQGGPHFMHGFGYDYSIGTPRNASEQLFMGNGLSYAPRYVFPVNENLSYGLGLPLGASIVQSVIAMNNQSALGWNYALCADVHVGMGATESSTSWLGCFFGLGFGTYNLTYFNVVGTSTDAHYGPFVQVGFRIPYNGEDISVAVANWRGINAANGRSQVFALKLIYELY